MWLQPSETGRHIATKPAVVLSQACGNGVYEKFSEDTFPAVPAQEPVVISTCRASLEVCRAPSAGNTEMQSDRSACRRPRIIICIEIHEEPKIMVFLVIRVPMTDPKANAAAIVGIQRGLQGMYEGTGEDAEDAFASLERELGISGSTALGQD